MLDFSDTAIPQGGKLYLITKYRHEYVVCLCLAFNLSFFKRNFFLYFALALLTQWAMTLSYLFFFETRYIAILRVGEYLDSSKYKNTLKKCVYLYIRVLDRVIDNVLVKKYIIRNNPRRKLFDFFLFWKNDPRRNTWFDVKKKGVHILHKSNSLI